jgi:hypothetical protein
VRFALLLAARVAGHAFAVAAALFAGALGVVAALSGVEYVAESEAEAGFGEEEGVDEGRGRVEGVVHGCVLEGVKGAGVCLVSVFSKKWMKMKR